ncbi:primase-like DNA-binding domain-containing protein [Halalkaliarchaeum sp. AArc-GB]|uniref:primase-like DNA-binding domain-containing protein n=1 Tax=Halalkaliarchaeum sp. AArc-GB TaxID=3074078 RepID=UPI0028652F0B|nr:primase-like DNA-binding domain-containing protein [Halalkaliarchaeum sp. AArc-GB]MDR5673561.1 primase-like DNA-binding domain-containing protein [Halalkaliarchaeum sp. AArc-GB]
MTEYVRVTPTSERLRKENLPAAFESLHKLSNPATSKLANRVNPLVDTSPPTFEFVAISEGTDEPVEFYYGIDQPMHLDTLEKQLKTIYPDTFDIERVDLTLTKKLIPPMEFSREAFQDRLERGQLLYQPDTEDLSPVGVSDDSREGHTSERTDGGDAVADFDTEEAWSPQSEAIELEDGVFTPHPPERIPIDDPLTTLDRPTETERGTVFARPTIDDLEPVGVQWYGQAERKRDWMTTIKPYAKRDPDPNEYDAEQQPIAVLIDHLTEAEHPIAFQVVWQRKSDWSDDAALRKEDLMEGRDTFAQRYLGPMFEMENRPDDDRNYQVGSAATNRFDRIEAKHPKRTFTVNVRAVALPMEGTFESLDRRLDQLSRALDPLDGPFYGLDSERIRAKGFRQATKQKRARRLLQHVRDSEIVTGRGKRKPDLVFNADELANVVVVPSSEELTVEGGRGTRSEQRSRNPLPRPHPDLMDEFRNGMTIGYALDETGEPEDEPTCVPPSLLTTHFARFGTTGAGKSKASINDALSLYDSTDGPIIIIDPKGDGMCQNYMRAHARRFGTTDLEENVLHFPIPEILPGFAFFNIEPSLRSGVNRVDAVQDKADHYETIIKMVMGEERYEQAVVAPNLIKYIIKILYDEEYGLENGLYRESVNYFSHNQLEHILDQLWQAGPPEVDEGAAPRSRNPQVAQKIHRQLQLDPNTFATIMGGVSNRFDYISQDEHLRHIFNNTDPQFDFRELLDDRMVILFELGDLRDDAAKVMTGLIMTMLYDALKQRKQDIEQKPDDYVVNLLVDEASSVVVSDIMNTLLEKGRSFQLSVGLSLQFPEQLETEGNRKVYLNVLNDVGSPIVGKIHVDQEIARVMAHEDMDPEAFANRIRSLPRGEWITRLPSPTFGETGPEPFSLAPLPIPPGHLESEYSLSEREETDFQTTLDAIHERTRDSYGVASDSTTSTPEHTPAVATEADDDQPLDVAIAQAIRTVQINAGVRDENGWVTVSAVDDELLARLDEEKLEDHTVEAFPDIRERSPLIEVDLDAETAEVVCQLTPAGEEAATPDTDSPTGGGESHDRLLFAVEELLGELGFSVQVLDQDGRDRPDGLATHPDVDPSFTIEIETTTHTRPAKVLANLRKAQAAEKIPLFVVDGRDDDVDGRDLARRVSNILEEPVNRLKSGKTRLYTTTEHITFNGGASASDGVTAARRATDNSRQTRWVKQSDEFALEDSTGEIHVRVTDFETVSKDQFPATYSYDESAGTYTVFQPGELPATYDSKDAFEAEWVPIKRPFVPTTDLPVPDYTDSSYAIGIVTEDGQDPDLQLYDPTEETIESCTELVEGVQNGELYPAGAEPDQSANGEPSAGEDEEDDPFGLSTFVHDALVECDDGIVPVGDVYDAYEQFASAGEYDVKPKSRFTQALREHVGFERDKKWLDGKTQRCYVGIELRDSYTEGSNDGEA